MRSGTQRQGNAPRNWQRMLGTLGMLLIMVPTLLVLCAAAADAQPGQGHGRGRGHAYGQSKAGATSVPEFDPQSSGAAVALLVGGALVLSDSRRGRRSKS